MSARVLFAVLIAAIAVSSPAMATSRKHLKQYTYNPNIAPPQPAVAVRSCAYTASSNFCPTNLVPVMVGGQVSCGTPNAGQCTSHTPKPRPVYRQPTQRRVVCPVGEKGCYTR